MERKKRNLIITFFIFLLAFSSYLILQNQKIKIIKLEGDLFLKKNDMLEKIDDKNPIDVSKGDKLISGEDFKGYLLLNGIKVIKLGGNEVFNVENNLRLKFGSLYSSIFKFFTKLKFGIETSKGLIFLSSLFF